jgi:GT2 family glycosyltransferase
MASVARDYSAVTGACMMVRRESFEALRGIDERYKVAYGDIDFCLRLRERGLRVVFTPEALLYHHECATRGTLDPPEDGKRFRSTWPRVIAEDPCYNPNLSRTAEDFSLRV